MENNKQDIYFMKSALSIARRGLGRVSPNPAVGCVIVKGGAVVGRGRTADGGRPHAETVALEQAGRLAQGSTVYVTLEPCAHEGETPSCAKTLVEAGVKRVVIACTDPDPRTAGQGIAILKGAGIEVEPGVCEKEAAVLNAGFFSVQEKGRPFIAIKTATSADEKVAGSDERWITGAQARARAHLIRSQFDAILAGSGTAIADDPSLTTRVPGLEHDIRRFIWDRRGRVQRREGFERRKEETVQELVQTMAQEGVTRLLVEGGPTIHKAFIDADLYDEVNWFQAPHEIGAQGLRALENMSFRDICQNMDLRQSYALDDDILEIYARNV